MRAADLLVSLATATIAASVGILVVLMLRRPLRRVLDPGAAYLGWVLVPLAAVAVLVPSTSMPPEIARVLVVPGTSALATLATRLRGAESQLWAVSLLILWVVGAVAAALVFARRQLQFERGLGRLQAKQDGTFVAEVSAGLPAVVGVFKPRIVLPADHATRFDAPQRSLVREHESVHVARGDQLVNLLAMLVRCVCWFNPLVHWVAPRFRHDQELACDARVIARHPGARRSYAEALLGTQGSLVRAPLTCQISFGHPLRERIAMLKRPSPSRQRRAAGIALVLAWVAGIAYAANAAKTESLPPDSHPKVIAMPDLRDFYPPDAVAKGVGGVVKLRIHVKADGMVDEVEVQSADPPGVFDATATEFAKQLMFSPARKDGKPVASWLVLPFRFTLHDVKEPPADPRGFQPITASRS